MVSTDGVASPFSPICSKLDDSGASQGFAGVLSSASRPMVELEVAIGGRLGPEFFRGDIVVR